MKKNLLLIVLLTAFASLSTHAQFSRYVIKLKHKGTNPYSLSSPSAYLTPRAIARRTRYNIAIDSLDLPITPRFIDSIRLAGAVTILNSSKWLNQVAIQTNDAAALVKINAFPFVQSANPVGSLVNSNPVNKKLDGQDNSTPPVNNFVQNVTDVYNYGTSFNQINIHNGQFLHNRGYTGQGMQMAVLDAGFYHYLTLPTFDSIRLNNQILGTWDFVTGDASVNEDHTHGMQCLSTIAANIPNTFVGTAPKTSFYLYRTEDAATEYPIEEQNWAAGAERADSLGVDVLSTSLGYTTFDNIAFNYTYSNMDGNTTMIAKASDIAAKKGLLAVVAAGNEGSGSWHYISTPADADSAMAIGAVNASGVVGGFSSYGPSSDGQIKPSVAAVGVSAVIANSSTGQPSFGSGTSFACPNMAGLSTCLWQAFPEVNNMSVINALQQSATRATNPDDRVGYGIPNMKKAFVILIKQLYTQQIAINSCKTNVQFSVKTDTGITVFLERKLASETNYSTINTYNTTGLFAQRNFTYTDDLATQASGAIMYRLKIKISADTTFFIDSATVNFIAKPSLGADKSANICGTNGFNLTTQFTTTNLTTSWTLAGNAVANPAAVSTSGNYQLIATNPSGCSDTAMFALNIFTKPNLGADKNDVFCLDSAYNLNNSFVTTGLTTNWSLNGVAVTNTSAVTTAGTYQLIASNTNCSDTALITILHPGIPCAILESITISPNPVSDKLKVVVKRNTAATVDIIINNDLGQRVHATKNQQAVGMQTYTVSTNNFASGIYYVTVLINNKKEMVKKIVKQ